MGRATQERNQEITAIHVLGGAPTRWLPCRNLGSPVPMRMPREDRVVPEGYSPVSSMIRKGGPVNIGKLLWSVLLPRWKPGPAPTFGYTLLLPVPGDLPVFAQLALDVCKQQDPAHRVETLVIPDLPSPPVQALVRRAQSEWPELKYVAPARYVRPFLRMLNDPGRYHGVQLITGVQRARGSHIILHDADAILTDTNFLAEHFAAAARTDAAAVGVNPYWDDSLRRRRPDLIATWEMCAQTAWLRGVPPQRHLGHIAKFSWGEHLVDTTIYAQMKTQIGSLALHGTESQFVHFNYVISTYRKFQAHSRDPFPDDNFRLLLIRVLSDALGTEEVGAVPTVAELSSGTTDSTAVVSYPAATPQGQRSYGSLRWRLVQGLAAIYGAHSEQVARLRDACAEFDRHYGYERFSA